jgi:glutamyl-tRNA synthetase
MHLGNAFAGLGAWLGARSGGPNSRFLLRIEDIDRPRTVPDADRWIVEDLAWLGLDWDGEPVYQSERLGVYEQVLEALGREQLEGCDGQPSEWLTYPCYCTRAQLRAASAPQGSDGFVIYPGTCRRRAAVLRSSQKSASVKSESSRFIPREGRNPAVRLAMPREDDPRARVDFCELLSSESSWNLAEDVGDIVLRRSDGLFAYQLAVVVDDYVEGVNQVVRGRDLLRSTAAQVWLRQWVARVMDGELSEVASQAENSPSPLTPEYAHLPLLLSDTTHERLAKRDHSLELATLRAQGVAPERVVGYLAYLMGLLSAPDPCTPRELLAAFSWEKIRASGLADRQTNPSILTQ